MNKNLGPLNLTSKNHSLWICGSRRVSGVSRLRLIGTTTRGTCLSMPKRQRHMVGWNGPCRAMYHKKHGTLAMVLTSFPGSVVAIVSAEWTQARKMVKSCKELTGGNFRPIHAFHIGMFGIRYRTPNGTRILWPNQFIWLLEQHLFDWRDHHQWSLSQKNIQDRSKADGAAKLLALGQAALFVAQSIVRTIKNLPLAPFESMTLSYIPLFGLTYFFWWVKPKDIETPSEIVLPVMSEAQTRIFESMTISNDFDDEGMPRQTSYWAVWYLTPRIFEKVERDREIERAERDAFEARHTREGKQPTVQCSE